MNELFKYFLYLGATGFGGPLSLIQQMRQHLVEGTQQMSAKEFDQAFTLVKAMPGPIAYQMAVYCGQHLKGRWGGILLGLALIFPSFVMMILLAIGYEFFNNGTWVVKLLNGFQFSVAAILLWTLRLFFKQFYQKVIFWVILLLAATLYFYQVLPEPVIIIGFGTFVVGLSRVKASRSLMSLALPLYVSGDLLLNLFKVCAMAGAIVFGTGLALLPVLQNQFVVQYHWLPLQTFNDGVTFGQMTPGPVTITATFLGYKIAGMAGALVATLGIFIFPTFHMLTWFPKVLGWLSKQAWIQKFLLGATAAVVGVLLITVYQMNQNFTGLWNFWLIFLLSFSLLLYRPKTQILWVILAGGLMNLFISFPAMYSI